MQKESPPISPPPTLHSLQPSAPAARQWTPEQLAGIRTVGRSVLVSAAAGSGKTAMLAERCAYLVCDAPPPYRCEVDELLVVTFTESAAGEMRERIGRALRDRVQSSPERDDRLSRQIHLIDQAVISTLHGFCARLLRQHFHRVGLDPAFTVMDGEEAYLLRLEIGRELIRDSYELDHDGLFQRLVDAYAEGNDERLLEWILKTHGLLTSVVDPAAWLESVEKRIADSAADFVGSQMGQEMLGLVNDRLEDLRGQLDGTIDLIVSLGGFAKYVDYLHDVRRAVGHWQLLLLEQGPDVAGKEVFATDFPKLPSIANDVDDKAVAKSAVDALMKQVKAGDWRKLLRFTAEQWRAGMELVRPHASLLLKRVREFGSRYAQAKAQSRQLDFGDLERFAFDALRDRDAKGLHPGPAARICRRQFKHVLVDEYQDINELQDAILSLVSRDGSDGAGNLFTVGDVKQSIYRFRLAEPQRFLSREERFRRELSRSVGQIIDLRANFRSRGPLLDAINFTFERLMSRDAIEIEYDESHRLTPGKVFPEPGINSSPSPGTPGEGGVRAFGAFAQSRRDILNPVCPGMLAEDTAAASKADSEKRAEDPHPALSRSTGRGRRIVDHSHSQPATFRGAPVELHSLPSKLVPVTNSSADDELDADRAEREAILIARRIRQLIGDEHRSPAVVLDEDGETYRPIAYRDVVILLRSMRHKADSYARILRDAGIPVHSESGTGYFNSVEVRDMLSLLSLLENQRQDLAMAAVLRSPLGGLPEPENVLARVRLAYRDLKPAVPLHVAAERYAKEQDDEVAAWLRDFFDHFDNWREMAFRRPLAETIATIYEQTAYPVYVAGLPGGEQRAANLAELHRRATEFGRHQRQGLGRFLEFLEGLRDEADLSQASIASDAENVVRIMSIHRSKGLEFPVVIVPDLGKTFNLTDCTGPITIDREAGLGMVTVDERKQARYPSLASTLVQERLRRKSLAEEARVLYVAMTRAKEHLILVGTSRENAHEQWQARWSNHRGPLPGHVVLSARTPLDWLGPVAMCAPGIEGPMFAVSTCDTADLKEWTPAAASRRAGDDPFLQKLANLEPIDPAPPMTDDAREVIERLEFIYPHRSRSSQPAARSVTAGGHAAPPADTKSAAAIAAATKANRLELPSFLAGERTAAATEIGTATHLVLQLLDFTVTRDEADLDRQIARLVELRLLQPSLASSIDRAGILWFIGTPLCQQIRENADRLTCELPVYFAASAAGEAETPADPFDQVMVRGRLDAMLTLDEGVTLIDYKTDNVDEEGALVRTEIYRPQLMQYADALHRITGRRVVRSCLVFIKPRMIAEL